MRIKLPYRMLKWKYNGLNTQNTAMQSNRNESFISEKRFNDLICSDLIKDDAILRLTQTVTKQDSYDRKRRDGSDEWPKQYWKLYRIKKSTAQILCC
jgi:hypothetical protein